MVKYGTSVNSDRQIPSAYDGLKPVQRRILLACLESGIRHRNRFRKAARLVGACMSGLASARRRVDLRRGGADVPGMGVPGSAHGEARELGGHGGQRQRRPALSGAAVRAAGRPHAQGSGTRPACPSSRDTTDSAWSRCSCPAAFPNLLLNGSSGIGYGFSSDVPPHNPAELAAAVETMIAEPDATDEKLLSVLPGPDFPTGGTVVNADEIPDTYRNGRGRIVLTSKVEESMDPSGRPRLEIREIPWGVTTTRVVEDVVALINEGKLRGASRQGSDRWATECGSW